MPTIITDAGPIIALFDSRDDHHDWAIRVVYPLPRPWIVCRAALIEVTHYFNNTPRVLKELIKIVPDWKIEDPAPVKALELMLQFAPVMDYADACAVLLARAHKGAVVVTTDHRDFSTYKVPFISPRGAFHP